MTFDARAKAHELLGFGEWDCLREKHSDPEWTLVCARLADFIVSCDESVSFARSIIQAHNDGVAKQAAELAALRSKLDEARAALTEASRLADANEKLTGWATSRELAEAIRALAAAPGEKR